MTNLYDVEYDFNRVLRAKDTNLNSQKEVSDIVARCQGLLRNLLGIEPEIVTVRSRSGYLGSFLRPIYSQPKEIAAIFEKPDEYNRFDFTRASFGRRIPVPTEDHDRSMVLCVYDIEELEKEGDSFDQRISTFLDKISEQGADQQPAGDLPSIAKRLRNKGRCYVIGQLANDGYLIDHLLAIYSVDPQPKKHSNQQLEDANRVVGLMFAAIDEVERRDRQTFMTDALKKISELVPVFSSPETSPATAVAALLNSFGDIFRNHRFIGPNPSHARGTEESRQWLRFIKVQLRPDSPESTRSSFPTFTVYPRAVAKKTPIGSYLIAHKRTRSTVKYLVNFWAQYTSEPRISSDFTNLFEEIKLKEISHYPRESNGSDVKAIVVSASHQKEEVWAKLNQELSTALATQTTAAFLMTNSADPKVPFAVLAFESSLPDAFSEDDLDLLSQLVAACAPLLSSLKMSRSEYDYSSIIKSALADTASRAVDAGHNFGAYLFELLRLDTDALRTILDEPEGSSAWQIPDALDRDDCQRLIAAPLSGFLNIQDYDKKRAWLRENEQYLCDCWRSKADGIDEFLSAIPSNDMWHCYLNAIPRALAGRDFSHVPPKFSVFEPGYSALAMFIVNKEKELRQIIKLSTKNKINKERASYRDWVRYRIPLSARQPGDGWAVETNGESSNEDDGFGALVSDLIGGDSNDDAKFGLERPRSLLDECAELDKKNHKPIVDGIKHHFTHNVALWRQSDVPGHPQPSGVRAAVEVISRLTTYDDRTKQPVTARDRLLSQFRRWDGNEPSLGSETLLSRTVEVLGLLNKYYNKFIVPAARYQVNFQYPDKGSDVRPLVSQWCEDRFFEGERSALPRVYGDLSCIMHGDLNGHNLAWSAQYKKFFIIDFEHVGPGFRGADQFKLLASLIAELIPQRLNLLHRRKADFNSAWDMHSDVVALVEYMSLVRRQLSEPDGLAKNQPRTMPGEDERRKLRSIRANGLVAIAGAILNHVPSSHADEIEVFLKFSMYCFMLKQFEYPLRRIDLSVKGELETLRDNLMEAIRKNDRELAIVKDISRPEVASLAYAYLGFLASVPPDANGMLTSSNSMQRLI